MFNDAVLVLVEVVEPNKKADIRYISIGTTDINMPNLYLESKAIDVFKGAKKYPSGTTFKSLSIHRFTSLDEYLDFFKSQVVEYLNS